MQSTTKKAQYLKLAFPTLFILLFSLLLVSPVSEASVERSVSVVGELRREMLVQIGQTYRGIIYLKNHGEKSRKIKLYQTDYLFFSDGTNIYGDPGELERSNANWLTFSPTRVEVPPGQTVSISYILEVPDDDSLVGTYWSILMIELPAEMKELSEDDQTGGSIRQVVQDGVTLIKELFKRFFKIRQIVRYGMQFVTHIGDSGSREFKFPFPNLKLLPKEGGEGQVFQFDLENTGQRELRPEVWVDLYNEEGHPIGRFESERKYVYPGTSVRHQIDLSNVPKGRYKAQLVIYSGDESDLAVSYTLNF